MASSPMVKAKTVSTLFYGGGKFLAGRQPSKSNMYSGIGGKIEPGEPPIAAAAREIFEELFGFHLHERFGYNIGLYRELLNSAIYIPKWEHVLCFISFDYFETILARMKNFKSPFYEKFPTTIDEMIKNRKVKNTPELLAARRHGAEVLDLIAVTEREMRRRRNEFTFVFESDVMLWAGKSTLTHFPMSAAVNDLLRNRSGAAQTICVIDSRPSRILTSNKN